MLLKRIKWRNVAKLLIAVTGADVCISYAYGKTYDCYSQTSSKEMIVASHVQEEGFKEYEIPERIPKTVNSILLFSSHFL